MRLTTRFRRVSCLWLGHKSERWERWKPGKKKHTKRKFYLCARCGRVVV